MAVPIPTLYWFDRFDDRIGTLKVAGELTHAEELNGEDTLEFRCREVPAKGDRLLWRDGGEWREHVVVRTDEPLDGICSVYAESSLCELLVCFVKRIFRFSSPLFFDCHHVNLSGFIKGLPSRRAAGCGAALGCYNPKASRDFHAYSAQYPGHQGQWASLPISSAAYGSGASTLHLVTLHSSHLSRSAESSVPSSGSGINPKSVSIS